jgi:hypothetical protein
MAGGGSGSTVGHCVTLLSSIDGLLFRLLTFDIAGPGKFWYEDDVEGWRGCRGNLIPRASS